MTPRDAQSLVIVGRVRRAHGIRGELVVEVLTESPDAIFAPGARLFPGTVQGDLAAGDADLIVADARWSRDSLLVRFEQIEDRTAAERWRERYLLVPLDEVGEPDEDEVFVHDLVGLDVILADGTRVGRVSFTLETAAGLLLEIQRERDTVLLPYDLEFIREVDVEGGHLTIDPPAGMFDDQERV